jgi:homogentisate 1,2-dioxygenase
MDPQNPNRRAEDVDDGSAHVVSSSQSISGNDRVPQERDDPVPAPLLRYLHRFGNAFESEAVEGALPAGRNNPRLVPYNLYAEQLSGTAFTAPRAENRRMWLYRIQPAVVCGPVDDTTEGGPTSSTSGSDDDGSNPAVWFGHCDPAACRPCTDPCRWGPMPVGTAATAALDFCTGMRLMCTSADHSLNVYAYACTESMDASSSHLNNTDGDFLIVPQARRLRLLTELGQIELGPGEIAVVPRGIIFQVQLEPETDGGESLARGYVLEVTKGHFALPELGPIVRES